ncbi:GyrI-like domain-containing protein [Chitinispirillales bacterium ANBcel5]|uniref:GyrI-like domain-containing protein n=1 Tax=Cellulosispirillum alkaliphilum TaxID=3039283 RepID=UPI002A565211|nr:GyrI-like domain-containing protein [Chitinispirillales bacterium ANBcel5]
MEIKEVNSKNSLAVRLTTSFSELPKVIGNVYGEIMEYMSRKGLKLSGYPYVLYHNMDMDNLDIDIGWQTEEDDPGDGARIRQSKIPGGRVVYALHTGPYATLEKTYEQVMAFIDKNGLKTQEWMYEVYLNSPENTPESELKTEIYFPLS